MKRLKTALLSVLLGIGSAISISAGVLENLPADTKGAAKLDLDYLRASSIFIGIKEANLEKYQQFQAKFELDAGIDPEKIRTVWAAGAGDNKGLIVLEGEFNPETISKFVASKPEFELINRPDCLIAAMCPDKRHEGKKNLAALVDSSLIVAGDPDYVDSFIKNFKGGKNGISANDRQMLEGFFSDKILLKGILFSIPDAAKDKHPNLSGVKTGEMSVSLTDEILMDLKISMTNEEQASAIESIANGMLVLAKNNARGGEKGKVARENFFKNLVVSRNGAEIDFSTKIEKDVIDQLVPKNGQK